ncbi:hypothetical protein CPB86DRAFT_561761 [Serendipita vermifera]|nr:hypothetical protein CPB86DRAFT_561761 [Serendipita vermifera]
MDATSSIIPYPHPRHWLTVDEILFCKERINALNIEIAYGSKRGTRTTWILLLRDRDNYMSYISPIRCLPVEILTEIFRICIENGVSRQTMTRICGTFREIVIGMSTIWRTIRLGPPFPVAKHVPLT